MSIKEEIIETTAPLTLAHRLAFIKLPIEERRRILAEQAEQMTERYEGESLRSNCDDEYW